MTTEIVEQTETQIPAERIEDRSLIQVGMEVGLIETPADYENAAVAKMDIDRAYKSWKKDADAICKFFNDRHKAATKVRASLCAPYVEAINHVEKELMEYRKREAEERRKAEERIALEGKKRAEEAALAAAEQAEEAGNSEKADAILSEPAPDTRIELPTHVPKVAGYRKKQVLYRARVTDKEALLRFVLYNYNYFNDLVEPCESTLNAKAKAAKGDRSQIPGVEFYKV